MTHEAAIDFLRTNHRAVLATYRKDGQVQLSPVLTAVDSENRVVISTRRGAMKTLNVQRHPRAALCALTEHFFGGWHSVEGTVEIVRLPEAMEPLIEYYRASVGEHPDWEDYRQAMERDERVLLRITVDRSGPTTEG